MSNKKKISNNEDQFLAELEASKTGEEHDFSAFEESMNSMKNQALDDLEQISGLFSEARPDPGEIPESVDNIVLGHIRQKSREIRREHKVVRIFPHYRWAAAAVMGILVFMVSYRINKTDIPENVTLNNGSKYNQTELAGNADKNEIKEALHRNSRELKIANNDSGIKRLNRLENYYSDNDQKLSSTEVSKYSDKTPYNIENSQLAIKKNAVVQPVGISKNTQVARYNTTVSQPEENSKDIDGNGRINIIDAYLMDRRLMSGVAMPPKMDLNGDGNIDREDINTIVKTAVSLGKGEV